MKIRRIPAGAVVVAAAVSLSACSSKNEASGVTTDAPSSSSPASSAAAASSNTPSTSKTPTTEKNKIVQAYRNYYVTLDKIGEKKLPQSRIADVATGPSLAFQKKFIAGHIAKGHVGYGKIVLHPVVSSIENHGKRAIIQDCQDTSHSGWMDAKKKSVIHGLAQDSTRTTLVKVDGSWRVYRDAAIVPANEYCS